MRFTSLSAILVSSIALVGCGSSTSDVQPPADSGTPDTNKGDTGTPDIKPVEGGDAPVDTAPPPPPIDGSLDVTVRVVKYNYATKEPQADFSARIENAAGGFVEGKTGADGIAHLKVDPAKGPFDVTVAKAGFDVVSVLGVTGPIGDVYVSENGATPKNATIGGTITGKIDPANKVQIDAWSFATVVTAPSATTWSSKYGYDDLTKDPEIPLAGIEVDSTGKAINGVLTASVKRTGSAMTAEVKFPSPAVPATAKTINAKFPSTGVITGSKLTKVGAITSDKFLGNALVVKSTKLFYQMFVGIGDASTPASDNATIKLQLFGGDMAPDVVEAAWVSADNSLFARGNFKDLTDGATVTFGEAKELKFDGTDLASFTFSAEGTGYDYIGVDLLDSAASVSWVCYSKGSKLASRGLPHLPTSVKMDDVAAGFSPRPIIVLYKKTGGDIWSDFGFDYLVSNSGADPLDGTGR